MNRISYLLLYSIIYVTIEIASAWTAWQLARSTEVGPVRALNPFMNTESLSSLLLSPPSIIAALACIGFVAWCEFNRGAVSRILGDTRFRNVLLMPYYILLVQTAMMINNLAALAGWGTPVSLFTRLFAANPGFLGFMVMAVLLAALSMPVFLALLRRRYDKEHVRPESQNRTEAQP